MIKIDKAIILLYPLGLLLISFLLDNEVFMYSLLLLTSIIIYELFISQNQPYSGIRGIWLLATPSLIFVSYTVFISIPSIYIISTVNHPQALNYYLSILSFYLLFPVGLYYGNKIFPIQNTQVEKMYNMEWTLEMDHKLIYEILIIMLSIIILILCLYLIRVDTIPVFEIIRDPKVYKILFMLREESMKLLNVPRIEKYFYSWSRDLLIPLGIVTSLFLYIIDKKRKYFLLFLIYFSVGIFNNSITVAKLPIAAIFFSLMAMYLLRKRHFSFRMIIASLISIFSIPVMINYIASLPHLRTPEKLLYAIAYRLFVVPAFVGVPSDLVPEVDVAVQTRRLGLIAGIADVVRLLGEATVGERHEAMRGSRRGDVLRVWIRAQFRPRNGTQFRPGRVHAQHELV